MIIRPLELEEFDQAVDLKISCWDEELAGVAPNRRIKSEEVDFITHWISAAEEHRDIRLVYGAFEQDAFMGFAGASIAEPSDVKHGIELNYLFVKTEYRGRGLALQLIDKLLTDFGGKGVDQLVVYRTYAKSTMG